MVNMNPNKLLIKILLMLCAFLLSGCGRIQVPSDSIVISNGTLIDGRGGEPVVDCLVVVKDGKIWDLGQVGKFKLPKGVQVYDAKQGYILPGLIDTHVHISNAKSMEPFMLAGVTTVRDLGGPTGIMLARKWTRSPVEPRLLIAGPIITVPGGYPVPAWGDKVAKTITNPRDAEIVVDGLIEDGVDVIKVAITEGMDKEPWPTLTMEEIKAITATAHKHGVKVVAHILRAKDARRAIEGGVDQLGHDVIDELPQDLIMTMVNKNIVLIPTLNILLHEVEDSSQLSEQQIKEAKENLLLNVKRFSAMGGCVALGNDYGVVGIAMGLPLEELLSLQEAGLTPTEVISAATLNAAQALGKQNEIGTLEPGKVADILVTARDPLQDLHNLASVKGVLFKGEVEFWKQNVN
jgi:imidazolonepropionase-like amidohydrolase